MQQLRAGDSEVGAGGLGAMPLSPNPVPDADPAGATVHAVFDDGVTLIDTAAFLPFSLAVLRADIR